MASSVLIGLAKNLSHFTVAMMDLATLWIRFLGRWEAGKARHVPCESAARADRVCEKRVCA